MYCVLFLFCWLLCVCQVAWRSTTFLKKEDPYIYSWREYAGLALVRILKHFHLTDYAAAPQVCFFNVLLHLTGILSVLCYRLWHPVMILNHCYVFWGFSFVQYVENVSAVDLSTDQLLRRFLIASCSCLLQWPCKLWQQWFETSNSVHHDCNAVVYIKVGSVLKQ